MRSLQKFGYKITHWETWHYLAKYIPISPVWFWYCLRSRPGLFAGEWHNNHHLYPSSARAGFLPYQIDLAWIYIYSLHKAGGVTSYHDSKNDFLKKYRAGEIENVIGKAVRQQEADLYTKIHQ